MKDRNYFPFERNRYFYGKLLSVQDFQREQAYMNHKRRLLNRLLYGDGVLCGLQVLEVDEESISVEMGVALDSLGREIVLEQPVVKRLSVLDGFQEHCVENENGAILYLCIEYSEEEAEPVHCIGASANEEGKPLECNKWKEGCRLFLTSEEPEGNQRLLNHAYEETRMVFSGRGIQVRQSVPRFMNRGQDAVIRILIEKNGNGEEISFQYEAELTGASYQGKRRMTFQFRESEWEPADNYEVEYAVQASVQDMEGRIEVLPDSFQLQMGEHKQAYQAEGCFGFQVVSGSRRQEIWDAFYKSAAEDILNAAWHPPLYLARIAVIQAGDSYVIERIENLPYRQYVWNNRLLGALCRMELSYQPDKDRREESLHPSVKQTHQWEPFASNSAFGVAEISLGIGGAAGKCFYSEEIIHGLGTGAVIVTVGAVNPQKAGREIVYGTRDIFPEEKGEVNVETAVKLQVDRGSFRIGIRCLKDVDAKKLTVYWMAVRAQEDVLETKQSTMSIRPNLPRIRVRETLNLEALIDEEPSGMVCWAVKDDSGGNINENGLYTAPNQPGIYEIWATSMEDESLHASVYVIVVEDAPW